MLYVNPMTTSYAMREAHSGQDASERRVALKELEQHFVFTLFQEMRKSVEKSELLDGGMASEIHDQMLDEAMSAEIAESGQFGIARMLEQQLRIEELQHELRESLGGEEGSQTG